MKRLISAVLLSLSSWFAGASVLTGDVVNFQADPGVFPVTPVAVGAGDDLVSIFYRFDMNAGAAGDEFSWNSLPDAGNLAGSTSIMLTDLDFDDGSSLIGFDLFSTLLSGLVITTTADSISFAYTSVGMIGPGTVLSGRFITSAGTVPLPGSAPLLLTGLAMALYALRRRTVLGN